MAFGIPESTIQEIKARVDLADLISSYGISMRRAGADYKVCCPFHHEKTPSFVIHPNQGYYHCFGCGETGDCFKFVQKQEGLTFIEAVRKLAAQCGITIEEKEDPEAGMRKRLLALHAELADFFRRCLLQAPEAELARKYLASRALPDDIVERFKIGYAPLSAEAMLKWAKKYGYTPEELTAAGVLLPPKFQGGRWYNRFGGRLMFTITDRQDRAIAFSGRILTNDKKTAKYVNSPETVIFKKSNVLFALAHAAPNIVKSPRREAIICEGQIDVIRCHASGFPVAVASQGTAFTEEHVHILKKCADSVVLVFDADGAGQKADIRTGGLFLAAEIPVRVATLPEGEDPDSFLRNNPPEAFQARLDAAESVTHFQVRTLLAKETKPYSLRAITETSRAALATIALCPSAIMRAALLEEAAALLNLPVAALQEDFAKIKEDGGSSNSRAPSESRVARSPSETRLSRAPNPSPSTAAPSFAPSPYDEPPPDLFDDRPGEETPFDDAVTDAASSRVNPPPTREYALCEFLIEHEHDSALLDLLNAYAPDAIFSHEFSRAFVNAWREEIAQGTDAIAALRNTLPLEMCSWLDKILLTNERSALSELPPDRILKDFLRQLWMEAVRRRQGELPAESTPENDVARLRYSTLIRHLQRDSWERAVPYMTLDSLV